MLNFRQKRVMASLVLLAAVGLSYQNCAQQATFDQNGALVTNNQRADSDSTQNVWVSEEMSSSSMQKVATSSVVMILAERAAQPDLMCAGGCPLEYELLMQTSCGQLAGKLSYGFNESSGVYQSKVDLAEETLSAICTDEEAELVRVLSESDLQLEREDAATLRLVSDQLIVRFQLRN